LTELDRISFTDQTLAIECMKTARKVLLTNRHFSTVLVCCNHKLYDTSTKCEKGIPHLHGIDGFAVEVLLGDHWGHLLEIL
jgi:hypothetical protein